MMVLKKLLVVNFLIVIFALSGCATQGNLQGTVTKQDESTYTLNVPLNIEVMKEFSEKSIQQGVPNGFGNLEKLDAKETNVKIELSIKGEEAMAKGTVFYGEGSYDFTGKGIFKEFSSPDTGNVYYYGDIRSEQGFNFLTMFSLKDNRAYVETPVLVKIGDYKGKVIFGDKFFNKAYWDALYQQNK